MSEEKKIQESQKGQGTGHKPQAASEKEQSAVSSQQSSSIEEKPANSSLEAETSNIKLQTSNLKPETENMEVHKHPHHVTHKKKWGEYLLEFLMLFLAVFLGFIAENQREHIVERQRAKEFSKSLIQDLKNDITAINVQRKSAEIYIAFTDSLLNLNKTQLEGRNAAEFSFYTRFMYWTVPLSWNRSTFEQVKNSGSLRYFKNYSILEKLMKYDALVNDIEGEFKNHQTRGNMLLSQINKIIEPMYHYDASKYVLSTLDTMSKETRDNYFAAKTESLENKRAEIKEMLNMIIVQQRNLRRDIDDPWKQAGNLATELISDLKKEYHLE